MTRDRGRERHHLQVPSIAVSISLIDLSSDARVVLFLSPSRHSAATARNALVVPRYSPLTLQKVFLTEAFFLSSAGCVVDFLMSSMVWSTVLVATNWASSSALTTLSQASSARTGVPAAKMPSSTVAAAAIVDAFMAVPLSLVLSARSFVARPI